MIRREGLHGTSQWHVKTCARLEKNAPRPKYHRQCTTAHKQGRRRHRRYQARVRSLTGSASSPGQGRGRRRLCVRSGGIDIVSQPTSVLTVGGGGGTTIPSPGMAPKQPLPGIVLHGPLHCRQTCPKFTSFHQGVGRISPPEELFSSRPLPKRGQIYYIPAPPQSLNDSNIDYTGGNVGAWRTFPIWRDGHRLPTSVHNLAGWASSPYQRSQSGGIGIVSKPASASTLTLFSASAVFRNHCILETRLVVGMFQRRGYKVPIIGAATPPKMQK